MRHNESGKDDRREGAGEGFLGINCRDILDQPAWVLSRPAGSYKLLGKIVCNAVTFPTFCHIDYHLWVRFSVTSTAGR